MESLGAAEIEAIRHKIRTQNTRSLQVLDLMGDEIDASVERIKKLDRIMINELPDASIRIYKPKMAQNGTVSFGDAGEVDESLDGNRHFETDDSYIHRKHIQLPNLLIGLRRYTRATVFDDEFIMRVPVFGNNIMGKLPEDDVSSVIELTMDKPTFDYMAIGLSEAMGKEDKKGVYKNFQKFKLDENKIPEDEALVCVYKNMRQVFSKVNPERLDSEETSKAAFFKSFGLDH